MLSEGFAYPKIMGYFEAVSAIPRGSYNESGIADYLVDFAKKKGYEWHRDSANNVLINMPASEGLENKPALLLQGHTDMVCEKNSDVEHDFERDGLDLYEENGWIMARGTTLGADDGVAVAAMLAILDGACASHPPIQCLFTASEEVGLDGAKAFDYSRIYARMMINMDSAEEDTVIAGCAGGIRSSVKLPLEYEVLDEPMEALKLKISGLFGGHSGEDIHKGRANANKLMGYVITALGEKLGSEVRLVSMAGGSKDNAIPRECEAVVSCDVDAVKALLPSIEKDIASWLTPDDSGFTLAAEDTVTDKRLTAEVSEKLLFAVTTVAVGVFEMNCYIPGLVEYSRNLGVVTTKDDEAELILSSRSSFESKIDRSCYELTALGKQIGAEVTHYARYPGWEYAERSEIRDRYISAYSSLFGSEPQVAVIHAGLECGLISRAVPGMDIISCSCDILDLHSPDERMNKASLERFFTAILKTIESM